MQTSLHSRIDTADKKQVQSDLQLRLRPPPPLQKRSQMLRTVYILIKRRVHFRSPTEVQLVGDSCTGMRNSSRLQQHPRSAGVYYAALSAQEPASCASHLPARTHLVCRWKSRCAVRDTAGGCACVRVCACYSMCVCVRV